MNDTAAMAATDQPRVALAPASDDFRPLLTLRGLAVETFEPGREPLPSCVAGVVWTKAPTPANAQKLAPVCSNAAKSGRAVVILAAYAAPTGQFAVDAAIALGVVRTAGAIICQSPDTFIEILVLLAAIGAPKGPTASVVAPADGLIAAQAHELEHEMADIGSRFCHALPAAYGDKPDAVLTCISEMPSTETSVPNDIVVIPVLARGELVNGKQIALVGLRAALSAVAIVGRWSERQVRRLAPGDAPDVETLNPDRERFARQLRKLGRTAGDHETKVLLAAYGISVSRQAVATTASAAARIAKRAGYPVEIKPWGPAVPSELEGCPIELDLDSAAEVRRAFTSVSAAADMPRGSAVIVRVAPPRGRELNVRAMHINEVGWSIVATTRDKPAPIAAPAPLSRVDADMLAQLVDSTRDGDLPPNREALADLLIRVSHLASENSDVIAWLELPRIVASVEDDQVVVVDARTELNVP